MVNILSYVGMSLQTEVCMWTLFGLVRTIFDATLFKVNSNLKQVWQMLMPPQLSLPAQRVLRLIISGVMLVQCFTLYIYLASYIVLLYPVFLEERPNLVLPWLLLAAIRKFLCELTSLAVGLGACVFLGPARTPCVKFIITKVTSIMPAFYMWMLVYSYYDSLKMVAAFKIPAVELKPSDHDYGLELAVRRRRTKSLFHENQLRKNLVANLNETRLSSIPSQELPLSSKKKSITHISSTNIANLSYQDLKCITSEPANLNIDIEPTEGMMFYMGAYEDWTGIEVRVPRDADKILEQFVIMMLRIAACKSANVTDLSSMFSINSLHEGHKIDHVNTINNGDEELTIPPVDTKCKTLSYLEKYPEIFMKSEQLENTNKEAENVLTRQGPSHVGKHEKSLEKNTIHYDTMKQVSSEKITFANVINIQESDDDNMLESLVNEPIESNADITEFDPITSNLLKRMKERQACLKEYLKHNKSESSNQINTFKVSESDSQIIKKTDASKCSKKTRAEDIGVKFDSCSTSHNEMWAFSSSESYRSDYSIGSIESLQLNKSGKKPKYEKNRKNRTM